MHQCWPKEKISFAWKIIIYSPHRDNMYLECITLHHLFHACAHRICLCSSISHQSPSSVLTQSLWLGNAERERRWQWLWSYCVSQQSQTRCSWMLFLTIVVSVQTEAKLRGKESPAISRDSRYTYIEAADWCKSSRCVSTADEGEGRKLNPTWHCEPLASLCGRKQLFYLHNSLWSYDCVGRLCLSSCWPRLTSNQFQWHINLNTIEIKRQVAGTTLFCMHSLAAVKDGNGLF